MQTKQQQKVKELRLLPIVKHSKDYTGAEGTALQGVLYDGQSFVATNSHMLVQVFMKYPGLEAGTRIDAKGNRITRNLPKFPNFEFLFRNTPEGEAILHLRDRGEIKDMVAVLSEAHRATKDLGRRMDYRLITFQHGGEMTPLLLVGEGVKFIKKGRKTEKTYEIKATFGELPGQALGKLSKMVNLQSRYILRAVEVLYQHGAEHMEIHLLPHIVYVISDVGQAAIVPVR